MWCLSVMIIVGERCTQIVMCLDIHTDREMYLCERGAQRIESSQLVFCQGTLLTNRSLIIFRFVNKHRIELESNDLPDRSTDSAILPLAADGSTCAREKDRVPFDQISSIESIITEKQQATKLLFITRSVQRWRLDIWLVCSFRWRMSRRAWCSGSDMFARRCQRNDWESIQSARRSSTNVNMNNVHQWTWQRPVASSRYSGLERLNISDSANVGNRRSIRDNHSMRTDCSRDPRRPVDSVSSEGSLRRA